MHTGELSGFHDWHLCIAVPSATNHNDPLGARLAWGGEVLEGVSGVMGRIFWVVSKLTTHLKVGMAFLQ